MKKNAYPKVDKITELDSSVVDDEINTSKHHILELQSKIAETFVELGYAKSNSDVNITIGPEVEITQVAGQKSWVNRVGQIRQDLEELDGTNPNRKNDDYMPEPARVAELNKKFSARDKLNREGTSKVLVELEPRFRSEIFTDECLIEGRLFQEHGAFSQIEFTSPPRTPIGCAAWINKMLDIAVNSVNIKDPDSGAGKYGLKRMDFTACPHKETSPNSIHLNSVISVGGKNAFSAREWEDNENLGIPSDLLLCIGKAHMDYLKHSTFLFARAETDYQRFSREEVVGPTFIAVPKRKEHGAFSTAMFRGEGRKTERIDSAYPDKGDKYPMRFELRIPCPGAAGHPNKTAYPEQNALTYEMIEAYMQILYNGVQMWKEREQARRRGDAVESFKEEDFSPDNEAGILPHNKEEAIKRFKESEAATNYWGDRVDTMLALSNQLDEINRADRNPHSGQKGSHVNRR